MVYKGGNCDKCDKYTDEDPVRNVYTFYLPCSWIDKTLQVQR